MEDNNYGLIYKALFPNNKVYIGQTTCGLSKRKIDHKTMSHNKKKPNYNYPFYKAIRKYGWENITWEIIDKASNQEELDKKEIFWINYYRSCIFFKDCKGYNISLGGSGRTTYHVIKTQEETEQVLEEFKKYGNITEVAQKLGVGYAVINNIVMGKSRRNFTKIHDDSFYKKYRRLSNTYTNEQIEKIFELHEKGIGNSKIEEITNVPIRYIQDLLGGRVLSKTTGIKKVTREDRSYFNPVNSKTKKEEILEIVDDYYNKNMTLTEISKKYNKHTARISEIIQGKTWGNVTNLKREQRRRNNFTKEEVLDIIDKFYNKNILVEDIAKEKGTKVSYIRKIIRGDKWNKLTNAREKYEKIKTNKI